MLKIVLAAIQVFSGQGSLTYSVILETTEFCLIELDDQIVLVFFGSNSIADWLDNLSFFKTNLDSFPIGWHTQAIAAFQQTQHHKITYVVGYSRGAAIALIYSYYFNVQAIGFSTPNISKKLRYWKIKPVLISSLNDPIRCVPFGYKLPGNYIALHIEDGGHFWYKDKFSPEVKKSCEKHTGH
jgi:hypothetical protein